MRWRALLGGLLLAFQLDASAHAHEVRPGYLELRQTDPETDDVLWQKRLSVMDRRSSR
jgi:hypothetical protein